MPKAQFFCALVLASTCTASSAYADWQYTKWGMTPEQVQTAADSKLRNVTGSDSCPTCRPVPLLMGEYSAGGFQFKARFEFEGGNSLSIVSLTSQATSRTWGCNGLFESLSAKYGIPIWQAPRGRLSGTLQNTRWLDAQSGNTVFFIDASDLMGECTVQYSPLTPSKGL